MKALITISTFALLMINSISAFSDSSAAQEAGLQAQAAARETITLHASPEVYALTGTLVSAFNAAHPELNISLQNLAQQNMNWPEGLSIVTEKDIAKIPGTPWKTGVARDALVPFLNASNPLLEQISREGLTSQDFARLFTRPETENWGTIIGGGSQQVAHIFLPADETQRKHLSAFAGVEVSALKGELMASGEEMLAAVQKDPYAIGFCDITGLTDPVTNGFYSQIRVVPVDKNQNGKMDGFEKIYSNREEFIHGVWLGKYPVFLCTSLFAVAPSQPVNTGEIAFLEWLVSDGQQYMAAAGFSELTSIQKESAIEALAPQIAVTEAKDDTNRSSWWIIALITLFVAGLMYLPVFVARRKKGEVLQQNLQVSSSISEQALMAPAGLFFDKTHTWAYMEKEGLVKMGVDDFIQHITGPLTRIMMKTPGEKIRKGEVAVTLIRDGKQLNLYAPVTGTIRQVNKNLESNSNMVNSSPFNEGWIYQIEPKNWLKEIQYLLMGTQYRDWLKEELIRLKDFFADSSQKNSLVYSHVVLQDGGEITDHVLADMGPDVWEDFQTEFIDQSR